MASGACALDSLVLARPKACAEYIWRVNRYWPSGLGLLMVGCFELGWLLWAGERITPTPTVAQALANSI